MTEPAEAEPAGTAPAGTESAEAESAAETKPAETERGADTTGIDDASAGRRSGLRNPVAAVRGVGAGALVGEAIVLLLAVQPLRILGVRLTGAAITSVIVLAAGCVLLASMLRYQWAWWFGLIIQAALIACGYFHVSLAILGVLFTALWLYVMSVRRTVLGKG